MNKPILSVILFMFFFSMVGCSTESAYRMAATMSSQNDMYSKYNPLIIDEGALNSYHSMLKKEQGKVVKDKNGTYIFNFHNNDTQISTVKFQEKNESILERRLREGVGLMAPVLVFSTNSSGQELDGKSTEKLYSQLSKHLNLLPLSDTYKYAEKLLHYQKKLNDKYSRDTVSQFYEQLVRTGNCKGVSPNNSGSKSSWKPSSFTAWATGEKVATATEKGEYELYNADFYKEVLEKLNLGANYLISNDNIFSAHIRYSSFNSNLAEGVYKKCGIDIGGSNTSTNAIGFQIYLNYITAATFVKATYDTMGVNHKFSVRDIKFLKEMTDGAYSKPLADISISDIDTHKTYLRNMFSEENLPKNEMGLFYNNELYRKAVETSQKDIKKYYNLIPPKYAKTINKLDISKAIYSYMDSKDSAVGLRSKTLN